MAEKTLGPEHPNVATTLDNLARHHCEQGQHHQAEPLYERALSIMEKAFGPDHPNLAKGLENTARHYRETGRTEEAEILETRAARIRSLKSCCH
jgi:tetratricopeptide (TPR) repeat protein